MLRTMLTTAAALAIAACVSWAAELPSALVDPYLRIQAALAADATGGVQEDAAAIGRAAAGLGDEGQPIAQAAGRLEKADNLKAAREAFGPLSAAVIAYAREASATLPPGVAVAYCSMADKSWLQKGDAIRNPYYGSEMLECGEWKKDY